VKQLARFLRLERARQDTEPEQPAAPRRFDTLEEALPEGQEPVHPPAPAGSLERFEPEPDPALLLQPDDSEQPFVRCPHCGADSVRHARTCRVCEFRLDTDEVRAFNARLWAEMKAARDREAAEAAERRRAREAEASAQAADRRRLAEELAARVGAQERARLGREGPWFSAGPGWQLLRALPDARRRALAVALALGVPLLLLLLGRRGGLATLFGLVGLLLVVVLLVPRRPG
jgi:hypothetical protein